MKQKVTLYTTHCPKCKVLTKKLDENEIQYDVVEDIDEMLKLGIMSVPMLAVDGKRMDFTSAVEWVNEQ